MDREIVWNIVNSLLAGALVFLGALTDGGISFNSIIAALVVALSVATVQFKQYWQKEESEYIKKKKPKKRKTIGTFLP
jgi:hypothetical protein